VCAAAALAALLVAGCAGGVDGPTAEERASVAQIEASLPPERPRREATDDELALLDELAQAAVSLEVRAPWQEARFAPRLFGPADREELAAQVAQAGDVLAAFERALARPAAASALERGDPFAPASAKLGTLRNQVNLLCAAAVLAHRAGDDRAARRRVDAARALPRLLADGSVMGEVIVQAIDGIVDAAERVIAGGEAVPALAR